MKMFPLYCLMFLASAYETKAQLFKFLKVQNDSDYVHISKGALTIRAYSGTSFGQYKIGDNTQDDVIKYKTNDNVSFGVGFSYRGFGLSLSRRLPLINADDDKYGTTENIALQTYLYLRKFTIDLYAQQYKGYYMATSELLHSNNGGAYYIRPDLRTLNIGTNVLYVLNNRRFSYRASFGKGEVQRRSAGSFLLGGALHYNHIEGDSAVIPTELLQNEYATGSYFNRSNVFSLGFGGGYAYTWVPLDNWFVTGSVNAFAGIARTSVHDGDVNYKGLGLHTSGTLRLAAGFNSDRWYAGAQYVRFINRNNVTDLNARQELQTGVFRVMVSRRFAVYRPDGTRKGEVLR